MHEVTPAKFPGIVLENEVKVPASAAPESTDQDVHGATENAGYTNTVRLIINSNEVF